MVESGRRCCSRTWPSAWTTSTGRAAGSAEHGRHGRALPGLRGALDDVRHRAPAHLRRDYLMLAAQYAENLSRLVQESGDHG
jgi:hypothetical protein